MLKPILAIATGSVLGGLLRWGLDLRLNAIFPPVPLGTLSANLLGGYVIGLALACFAQTPGISPEWRLLIVTGFCGGLSTFSTFSAQVVGMLQRGQLSWAAGTIAVHVCGSLVMTLAGIASWQMLRSN